MIWKTFKEMAEKAGIKDDDRLEIRPLVPHNHAVGDWKFEKDSFGSGWTLRNEPYYPYRSIEGRED
jgi:hypothetical protein